MTSENTCYAFNKTGLRCTDVAGHGGQHSHTIQWTDEDLWLPQAGAVAVDEMIGIKKRIEIIDPEITDDDELGDDGTAAPGKCFVCSHPWHTDECDRLTEGIACGCTTAVA